LSEIGVEVSEQLDIVPQQVILPLHFRTRSIRNVAPVVQVERGATARPVAA